MRDGMKCRLAKTHGRATSQTFELGRGKTLCWAVRAALSAIKLTSAPSTNSCCQ